MEQRDGVPVLRIVRHPLGQRPEDAETVVVPDADLLLAVRVQERRGAAEIALPRQAEEQLLHFGPVHQQLFLGGHQVVLQLRRFHQEPQLAPDGIGVVHVKLVPDVVAQRGRLALNGIQDDGPGMVIVDHGRRRRQGTADHEKTAENPERKRQIPEQLVNFAAHACHPRSRRVSPLRQ